MALYRNKYNPDLVIDPTQQDLLLRDKVRVVILHFLAKNYLIVVMLLIVDFGSNYTKTTTQKPVYANDLMAGRVMLTVIQLLVRRMLALFLARTAI